MNDKPVEDMDLFMMCRELSPGALGELPAGFRFRNCREDELGLWMDMPFDTPDEASAYRPFMESFFERVYAPYRSGFFERCLFACDELDHPVATGFAWKILGDVTTFHWLKVRRSHEGRGLGRAVVSRVMRELGPDDFPVYLHTHAGSHRAVALYSDFGFELLTDPRFGTRGNDLTAALPYLEEHMPAKTFANLRTTRAPAAFQERLREEVEPEF